jgi:hypothetical protein
VPKSGTPPADHSERKADAGRILVNLLIQTAVQKKRGAAKLVKEMSDAHVAEVGPENPIEQLRAEVTREDD